VISDRKREQGNNHEGYASAKAEKKDAGEQVLPKKVQRPLGETANQSENALRLTGSGARWFSSKWNHNFRPGAKRQFRADEGKESGEP